MSKVVGVIGGMGPLASHAFYGELIRLTEARRDQDHLHVIIDSDATIPDRTAFFLHGGEDPRPQIMAAAGRLVAAGADLLVMPCNTAAAFSDEIRQAAGVPLVDWIDTAVDRLAELGARRVGILATSGTIEVGLYQQRLEAQGMEWVVPDAGGQEAVMDAIYGEHGVKSGVVDEVARKAVLQVAEELRRRGADAVVLGCTEIPLAVPSADPAWPLRAVDPASAVVRRVIQEAGGGVAEEAER
ncbi:MAG: aspartate/glutamate racemase family protein [Actinomycetota bacterium]